MVDIKKRSGKMERFDRNKLKNSLRKAGANERDAETATNNVERKVRQGTNTSEIREWAIMELRMFPGSTADNYKSYKKEMRAEQY